MANINVATKETEATEEEEEEEPYIFDITCANGDGVDRITIRDAFDPTADRDDDMSTYYAKAWWKEGVVVRCEFLSCEYNPVYYMSQYGEYTNDVYVTRSTPDQKKCRYGKWVSDAEFGKLVELWKLGDLPASFPDRE